MISENEMESLLFLSRLRLDPEERQRLAGQIGKIIAYFELLREYDTSSEDIDLGAAAAVDSLREDGIRRGLNSDEIDSFAVDRDEGFFVVPRILDT